MRRLAIVAVLALCARGLAQDKTNTVQAEQEQNGRIQARIDALADLPAEDAEELKFRQEQSKSASAKRDADKKRYGSGDQLHADEVRARIASLKDAIARLETIHAETQHLQSEVDVALLALGDEVKESKTRLLAARDAAGKKGPVHDQAWKRIREQRNQLYDDLRDCLRDHSESLHQRGEAESDQLSVLMTTLAMHRRENLLLRNPEQLDWDRTRDALADLNKVPAWSGEAGRAIGAYFSDRGIRPGVLRWAGSAFLMVLVVVFLGRGMRRRSIRMEQAASEEGRECSRALHSLYRFGRRGVHLVVIYVVPWSAAVMLPALPGGVSDFLLGIARYATIYYLVWAVYRELFRPDAPDLALARTEPPVRRRLGLAVALLLCTNAATQIPTLALRSVGYDNDLAYLLLELLLLLGSSIALSGIVFRRSIFTALLPRRDAPWARLVRGSGLFARPLLQLLLPLLFVLTALRYEALTDAVGSFSIALLTVVITGILVYQLLKTLWLQWIAKRYEGEADSDPAQAGRGAGLFALRVTIFLTGLWFLPLLAGTSTLEFRESLQIGLPFQDADSSATVWNLGAAFATGLIVWFGAYHAKALLQYQVLARTGVDRATQYTIATLFGYVVLTLGMVIALRQIVNLSALGTIVAALSVGIGFGMQDIVSNFISGIILLFERPIRVGDTIEVGANRGLVRQINIRATTVQTRDNIFILVPNRSLISNEVVNYGYDDPKIRLSIPIGVSYSSDPEQVRDVLLAVAGDNKNILKHPTPQVQFTDFGDSSLNFRLLAWIQRAEQRQRITSDINFAIFAAFKDADIEIPFPQRDINIRSAEGLEQRKLPGPEE